MSKMSFPFKGAGIVALIAVALASISVTSALAAGTTATATPGQVTALQNTWKSELSSLQFDSVVLGRADELLENARTGLPAEYRITSKAGVTLGAFERALAEAQAIGTTHAGFDASGLVTDQTQALASIRSLGVDVVRLRDVFVWNLEKVIRE